MQPVGSLAAPTIYEFCADCCSHVRRRPHGLLFGLSLCWLDSKEESCTWLNFSVHGLFLHYVQQDGRRFADKRTNDTERNPKCLVFHFASPPLCIGILSVDLVFNLDAQSGGSAPVPPFQRWVCLTSEHGSHSIICNDLCGDTGSKLISCS